MSGWKHPRTVDEFVAEDADIMDSVGFLYKKNKKVVVLVQSVHAPHNVAEALKIPRECVVSITKL